jgi:hypothetical protein
MHGFYVLMSKIILVIDVYNVLHDNVFRILLEHVNFFEMNIMGIKYSNPL